MLVLFPIKFFMDIRQYWLYLGLGKGLKTVLGSTYVVEQLSFSMFSSILTFDFDLIFEVIFYFLWP